ncbi:MAG: RNA 2'-phosphotransferase [Polyangiaceae bacterium]|nr:RNA 2'-phosphotransferase [Polyangiaceae bacterium]
MSRKQTATSKFLSLVLRHEPGLIGLALDADGWVDVDELLARCNAHGRALSRESLLEIVRTNSKQRFALSADGARIRASQGHSVRVELGYPPAVPPELLFHGTVAANLEAILARGLHKMARHHVHLSADEATARAVGARRGRPVVLRVASGRMHAHGMAFYVSDNGVWLTDAVPPEYLESPG